MPDYNYVIDGATYGRLHSFVVWRNNQWRKLLVSCHVPVRSKYLIFIALIAIRNLICKYFMTVCKLCITYCLYVINYIKFRRAETLKLCHNKLNKNNINVLSTHTHTHTHTHIYIYIGEQLQKSDCRGFSIMDV